MDIRQLFSNRLLQYSEGNCDCLEIFGSRGDMNIYGLEPCVVNDRRLDKSRNTSTKGILKLYPWLYTVFLRPDI